jgi:hypothetical protein
MARMNRQRIHQLLDRLLQDVAAAAESILENELTLFLGMKGRSWQHGTLVVGRAVNGWGTSFSVASLASPEQRHAAISKAFEAASIQGRDSMTWVEAAWGASTGYNTKRSEFWQVARTAVSSFDETASPPSGWSAALAWTNLYKLAPFSGGNPSSSLQKAQLALCQQLLDLEIQLLRPVRILCLTGWDWAESFFSAAGDFTPPSQGSSFVDRIGHVFVRGLSEPIRLLVARHPARKPRDRFLEGLRQAHLELETAFARRFRPESGLPLGTQVLAGDDLALGELVVFEKAPHRVTVVRRLRGWELDAIPSDVFRVHAGATPQERQLRIFRRAT